MSRWLRSGSPEFQDQFRIFTASRARGGLDILEQHKDEIGFVLADLNMPGEKGISLVEKARQFNTGIIGILTFAYAWPNLVHLLDCQSTGYDGIVTDVNTGTLYNFLSKPWDPCRIEAILKRDLRCFMIERERAGSSSEQMVPFQNGMTAGRIIRFALAATSFGQHFHNPFKAVNAYLDLAPSSVEPKPLDPEPQLDLGPWQEFYRQVEDQLERANNLLQDLWPASDRTTPEFADRVGLREIVGEAVTGFRDAFAVKAIRPRNKISRFLPALNVDRPMFYRLFELLLRAMSATLPASTEITLSATVLNGTRTGKKQIELQVIANGSKPWRDARFDAPSSEDRLDYRAHMLACYLIVYHHGGEIDVRWKRGEGTAYKLHLTRQIH